MSIFRKVARWAESQADMAERNKAARKAKAELKAKRKFRGESTADMPASNATVHNSLHSLEGVICQLHEVSGAMIVKGINDASDHQFDRISELIAKYQGITDEHIDKHVASLSAEIVDVLKLTTDMQTENLARVHEDIVGGHRTLHNIQTKKLGEIGTDAANTLHRVSVLQATANSQFLETIQHMREGRIESMALAEIMCEHVHNMRIDFNTRLEAIEANTQKRKRREEPTLEWLIDNYDELARFVKNIEMLRNNDAPPQMAMLESIRSIKSFGDYPTAAIKQAIETGLLAA